VPTIFTEVDSDPVGARFLCKQRRFERIRIFGTPGLAHRGHVIDVNP
jgi:hypothetical protein